MLGGEEEGGRGGEGYILGGGGDLCRGDFGGGGGDLCRGDFGGGGGGDGGGGGGGVHTGWQVAQSATQVRRQDGGQYKSLL